MHGYTFRQPSPSTAFAVHLWEPHSNFTKHQLLLRWLIALLGSSCQSRRTQFIETAESGSYKVSDRGVVCILEELLALEILKFWADLNNDSYVEENATLRI